jgi:RND family efflux transporter MFP subunit
VRPFRDYSWPIVAAAGLLSVAPAAAQGMARDAAQPVQCVIQPNAEVNLGSAVEGVLSTMSVDLGDRVKKGQVVAELESDVEKAVADIARARATADVRVEAARARLGYETRRLERNENLHKRKVVSLSAIDEARRDKRMTELELREAQFDRKVAQLELKRALAILERRTIKSPIDGVVVERFLQPGEFVHEQAPLLKLARVDLLNVEAFLRVADYGSIRPGMRAEVEPQQPVGGRYAAEVSVVDKVLNAASGTFRVRLTLANEDLAIPAGVRCTLRFTGPSPAR